MGSKKTSFFFPRLVITNPNTFTNFNNRLDLSHRSFNFGQFDRLIFPEGAYLAHTQFIKASMRQSQLKGVNLREAQLQGAYTDGISPLKEVFMSGEARINKRVGKPTELKKLSQALFTEDKKQELIKALSDLKTVNSDWVKSAIGRIREAPEKNPSLEEVEQMGAKVGSYTQQEADEWIKQYKKALEGIAEQ